MHKLMKKILVSFLLLLSTAVVVAQDIPEN